ncbi:MAG: PorV/PorQ family protein [candidate division Zixibacteria bacterium]
MKNLILKISIISIITAVALSVANAGNGPGTSVFNFLNIGVSARSSATGGALSAVSDGPAAAYYNPAGLASAENMQIAGMHSEWFQDLRYEYIGFASPVGGKGGFGISFSYLSYGQIDGYSAANDPIGGVNAYDLSATLSYGRFITPGLSLGVGFKTLAEKLDDVETRGFAGDFGLQYNTGRFLTGLSIMNFGPEMKYVSSSSPLPTTVNAGVSFFPFDNGITMMAGMSAPLTGGYAFKAGMEYSYANMLVLRTGYDSQQAYADKSGISFGGGLNLSTHSLDYAYNVNSMFGGTHQFSFVFRLGEPRETVSRYVTLEAPQNDIVTVPQQSESKNEKSKYYVCAAKYSDEDSAVKHIKTLEKFDISAKLIQRSDDLYWVVVKIEKSMKKAEKAQRKLEQKGISCYIIEL